MPARARPAAPGSGRRSIRTASDPSRLPSSWGGSCSDTARPVGSAGYPRRMSMDASPTMDRRPNPDAPLRDAPDPWSSTLMPTPRGGPPFHMTEMIEAEPALAERLLERLADPAGGAARLATEVRSAAELGRPILVTGCGTSEHGAQAFVEILREGLLAI